MTDRMISRRQFTIRGGWLATALLALFNPVKSFAMGVFSREALDELNSQLDGDVYSAADPHYESWRESVSWQLRKSSRRPSLIVQASSVNDVQRSLHFARQHSLKVSVRSGGHSWVHSSLRNNALLIDLRAMKHINIDPETMTAHVGPAVNARELTQALDKHGLAFPVAHCSTVALGGYLLGGGQAWNWGSWGGPACNSVKSLEVVNASGEALQVSESENPELFWLASGAGPGFPAVVTNYQLQLYRLPRAIRMTTAIWPLADTLAVSDFLAGLAEELGEKVETLMFLSSLPEPIGGHTRVVIISAVAFADSEEEARYLLEPVSRAREISTPLIIDEAVPMSMDSLLSLVDRSFFPCRAAADTFWFDQSMRSVMQEFVLHFAEAPSALSTVLCEVKSNPKVSADAAYSMRRRTYLSPYAFWLSAEDDEANLKWMKKTQDILGPLSVGHYINEADLEAHPARAEKSFDSSSWAKIQQLRKKYDPKGLFHGYLGKES